VNAPEAGPVYPIGDEALGNTSYVLDVGGGSAISIDPRRDVDEHLDIAKAEGLIFVAALETHLHADFVSGSREIAGAQVFAPAGAALSFPHRALTSGDRFTIGEASVEVPAQRVPVGRLSTSEAPER
jgi:glyoxylase-like metal-dependent hydrolase (beta-lactamase superfamily II)